METIDALGYAKEQTYDRVVSCVYEDWDTAEVWDINHNQFEMPIDIEQVSKVTRVVLRFKAMLGAQKLMDFFIEHIGELDDRENCLKITLSNDSMSTLLISAFDISPEKIHVRADKCAYYEVEFIARKVTTTFDSINEEAEYFRKRE